MVVNSENNLNVYKTEKGAQVVSAKELYEALSLNKTAYKRWCEKNIEHNEFFYKSRDWEVFDIMSNTSGGRPTKDYILKLEFAKHLAMMCRSEKGKLYRDYFLKMEEIAHKAVQQPKFEIPNNLADALILAGTIAKEKEQLEKQLNQEQKKVQELIPNKIFTDNFFLDPEQNLFSLQEVSNILGKGFGRTTLIKTLREKNILQQNNLRPLQQYIDREWFVVLLQKHRKDDKYPQTFITRKGFGHICKLLGILERPTQLNLFQNNFAN